MAKLLVVDDEKNLRLVVQKELSRQEHSVDTAEDGEDAWVKLESEDYDVLLCDINMPRLDGIELLRRLKERSQNPPEVIMLTGQGTVETAIEAMKLGAYDYITKPFNLEELELVVERAYQRACLRFENRQLRHAQRQAQPQQIVGNSAPVKQIRFLIDKVAPTDVPVLITGESGAGKEVAATAIQARSKRAEKPYVIKNCATLQKELARSELFGYVKG